MASLLSPLRPASLSHPTTHRNLHIITFHLPPSSVHFPLPTKLKSPFELSSPLAAPNWRAKVSFFSSFPKKKGKSAEEVKQELFDAIAPLDRGAEATTQDQERIDQIVRKLEALNSIEDPLKSDLLNGKWELIYTTSTSILQSQRPKILRPNGKIYQAINADTLRAQNMETWPFFNQALFKCKGFICRQWLILYLSIQEGWLLDLIRSKLQV